ncbi:hypothetical protein RhiirC2_518189 [Rhizophagus irregularis]|uniref:SH3 domain-containing protein n=1 Tax=Rhizophagus irregularis TaxID=588596 RepID=A0A2N1N525_9GLOM|nr:hypothetical protein RhiirC2_518189 [Rhizophagus irregularis]
MHSSNPPPLNTSFSSIPPSKRTSVVFEPYALHMIASVIRDLQFLRQQGYISFAALEEIIERLPKPVVHAAPHTPPAPSPSSSPIPQPESPAVSIKSDISQKRNSNTSITQRPPSTSSQLLQQQQLQREEQPLHSLAQGDDVGDLSFKKGDIVEVVEYVNMDWWKGRIQGTSNVGIFPRVYTKIL